jgi:hypothetical protein
MNIEKMEKKIAKMIAKEGLHTFAIALHNALAHGKPLLDYGCNLYDNDPDDYALRCLFNLVENLQATGKVFEDMITVTRIKS